jgi:hypothetical protein
MIGFGIIEFGWRADFPNARLPSARRLPMRVPQDDTDVVVPTEIEHTIEEIWGGEKADQLEQRYNFIDYHFELDGVYLRARAYLDDMEVAVVFGPFERRGSIRKVDTPEAKDAVLAYLRRRFRTVQQR